MELEIQNRASTGISGLDDALRGGLPKGHLFLFEGEPGTGKTTLGLQFLLQGAECGESSMMVSLSETRREIEEVARSHGWSLDGISIFEFSSGEDSLRPEDQYSAFHPSEVEFQDTMQSILQQIEQVKPTRIVFDSLSEIRLLARDSLRYRRQILALKHFFANRNCTVLLLDDDSSERHELQSIAHGVIRLERIPREYGVERRRIRISKLRGSRFREGFHDYTIVRGGIVVYPRLVAAEHRFESQESQMPSGLRELDQLCGGGLARGSSTLILGPAGSGKSSIAMHWAVHTARDLKENVSAFIFDETRGSALRRASKIGLDLEPLLDSGMVRIDQIDPAELAPGEFIQQVRDAVTERKTKLLIIDSLNGLIQAMPGEGFLTLQMHELLMYLNQLNVVTIMVMAQIGIVGSMKGPVDLSYLADNVLLLRYYEAEGKLHKAVSMLKKRSGEHEDSIRELRITPTGVRVGPPLSNFRGVLTGVPVSLGGSAPQTLRAGRDSE